MRLGDVDLSVDHEPSEPVTYKVKEIRAHPRFSRVGFYNDIAGSAISLLKLKFSHPRRCRVFLYHFSHDFGAASEKVKVCNSHLYAAASNSKGASHRSEGNDCGMGNDLLWWKGIADSTTSVAANMEK